MTRNSVPLTLTVLALSSMISCSNPSKETDVPLFVTKAWRKEGKLYLRRDGLSLLLRHSQSEVVYRYEPKLRNLSIASTEQWALVDTEITDCSASGEPDPRIFRIESRGRKLLAGERQLPSSGEITLRLRQSPTGRWLAVLSADDPEGSLFPFLGSGGARGQHYHQVLRAANGSTVGESLRLAFDTHSRIFSQCWSTDEGYVVYSDYFFTQLSIVTFNEFGI